MGWQGACQICAASARPVAADSLQETAECRRLWGILTEQYKLRVGFEVHERTMTENTLNRCQEGFSAQECHSAYPSERDENAMIEYDLLWHSSNYNYK